MTIAVSFCYMLYAERHRPRGVGLAGAVHRTWAVAEKNDWQFSNPRIDTVSAGYRAAHIPPKYVAFTLGGKPAVKPLASCKRVTDFSLETRYLLMLFVILQDDDNDKESNGMCGCSKHYNEKRNDVGELCTLVRARIVPLGPRICQNFTSGSFRVKSPNFQEIPHDPSQMFPKKLLKIPQCVLMTQTKF